MAQKVVTTNGTLVIPNAYSQFTVEQSVSGVAATGILAIVGEADQGPDFSLETDINQNSFGPTEQAAVVAKYGTGRIVDAFQGAVDAANDPDITGSFTKCIIVKTNVSTKATAGLVKFDSSSYATLRAKAYGKLGNLISEVVVAKTAEVVPTTAKFALVPPISATNVALRVNGGASTTVALTAQETPDSMASAIGAVGGVATTGGADLLILGSILIAGSLSLTVVSGDAVTVGFSVPFGALPAVGDLIWIPAGSILASIHASNAGSYIVTAAAASLISATKVLDVTGAHNALTPPITQAPIAAVANTDVKGYSALSVQLTAVNPIPGVGKTLEFNELTSAAGLLSDIAWVLNNGVPAVASWISKAASPNAIVSAAEYVAKLTASRALDGITEDLTGGGPVVLQIGYAGTTASVVNDGTNFTITVTGGSGSSPAALKLTDYPTVADLAAYINSLTGFKAKAATTVLGQQLSTTLDQGTFTFGSAFGSYTGRIKQDAYKFFISLAQNAVLVELTAQPAAGQPAPSPLGFLATGVKGGTTDAGFNAGIDKLEKATVNFVIPLFSRDATSDIADGLTDSSSSYTLANIHSYSRAHVLKMSTLKRARNRQGFLSIRDTFVNAQTAAGGMANYRVSMNFEDVKDLQSTGGVYQFQPWMGAVKAAGVQAAGAYRPLFKKGLQISGALQAAGDFDPDDDDAEETALNAGLMPIKQDPDGTWFFVSDQTTYGKDDNFVFNSVQAVYAADTIALTLKAVIGAAFIGQSVADVSQGFVKATIDAVMANMLKLKWTASSADAPKGYKNPIVSIDGGFIEISLEAKLAGAVYFALINTKISKVQQSG